MKYISLIVLAALFLVSCSDDDNYTPITDPDVVAEYLPNLSELNLYTGDIADLNVSSKAFAYELSSPLFTDYAHKERLIALPNGEKMMYDGDGLPIFPNNTVIAKTFYYNNNEQDLSAGRRIIETRVLIKINGEWVAGDYKWNEDQTDAVLDPIGSEVPVTWIDAEGTERSITYKIPSNTDCYTCHSTFDEATPIGPQLRTLNFSKNGSNQLQGFIDANYIDGIASADTVDSLPKWDDLNYSLEDRTRAYFDINCAHCHAPGGFCDDQSTLDLRYETSFDDSNIAPRKNSIFNRISSFNPGVSMPFIGTSILHDEGVALMQEYLNSLD